MMEAIVQLLQGLNINVDSGLALTLCCGGGCIAAVVLGFGLQFFGVAFQVVFGLVEFVLEILAGGPVAWCGCLVGLAGLLACGGVALALLNVFGTCGTAEQVNLCRIFGY